MELEKIVNFLDKELMIKRIKDKSRNGLQSKGRTVVKKIGFAVDACVSTLEKAKKQRVDLLIVHHGLKWVGIPDSLGLRKKALELHKKCGVSLYACHLPLDMHEVYGNNIQLANLLGLVSIKKFGRYHGRSIGYKGKFHKPVAVSQIKNLLDKRLHTNCKVFGFGKKKIRTVGIVSGGGHGSLKESLQLDCLLIGDSPYHVPVFARDLKHNVILVGHYSSETVGVKAVQKLINKTFKVSTVFIHNKVDL